MRHASKRKQLEKDIRGEEGQHITTRFTTRPTTLCAVNSEIGVFGGVDIIMSTQNKDLSSYALLYYTYSNFTDDKNSCSM